MHIASIGIDLALPFGKHGFPGNHCRHSGQGDTFGTCVGLIKPDPMSFARFSTDDTAGTMRGYIGQGRFTFGGAGVVEIARMQKLLHFICENGFEHHVAANLSNVASAIHEAAIRYLGWNMYWHERPNGG